jgi:hypothetical protein
LVSFDTTAYLRLALELSDQALRALQAAAMGSKERDAVREALREIRHFSWPLAGYANEFRQRIERLARGASAGATRGGGGGAMGGGSMQAELRGLWCVVSDLRHVNQHGISESLQLIDGLLCYMFALAPADATAAAAAMPSSSHVLNGLNPSIALSINSSNTLATQ